MNDPFGVFTSLGKADRRDARDAAAIGAAGASAVGAREARHQFHVARASRGQQVRMSAGADAKDSELRQRALRHVMPPGTPGRIDGANPGNLLRTAEVAHVATAARSGSIDAGRRAFAAARRGGAAAVGAGAAAAAAGALAHRPSKPKAPKYTPVSYR